MAKKKKPAAKTAKKKPTTKTAKKSTPKKPKQAVVKPEPRPLSTPTSYDILAWHIYHLLDSCPDPEPSTIVLWIKNVLINPGVAARVWRLLHEQFEEFRNQFVGPPEDEYTNVRIEAKINSEFDPDNPDSEGSAFRFVLCYTNLNGQPEEMLLDACDEDSAQLEAKSQVYPDLDLNSATNKPDLEIVYE